jgi:SAM-dependent methyltransferase
MTHDARSDAQQRLHHLLDPAPTADVNGPGYIDLLGEAPQAGPSTGFAQRLMRNGVVSSVYERWWRPALGRIAKGRHGPSMSEEHRIAADLLGLTQGQVVLDVACGTGAFTRGFAAEVDPEGLSIGLDASRTMLARAVTATRANEPVAYLRADAVRPPLRAGSLDAVCCFAALHLFDDAETALTSFATLLKPGGRLAVLTSARRGMQPLRTLDTTIGTVSGMRMFDPGEVAALLEQRGFTDVSEQVSGVVQIVGARRD